MAADVGNIFQDIFDAIAPVIGQIANALGIGLGTIVGFFFGGLEFLLTEIFFG